MWAQSSRDVQIGGLSQAVVEISLQYLYKAGAGDERRNDIFFEIVLLTGHDAASSISFRLCCAVKSPRSSTAYSKTVCSGSSLLSNTLTFASRRRILCLSANIRRLILRQQAKAASSRS